MKHNYGNIYSKPKLNRRDITDLTAKERMSMMWINLDGVTRILPISRSSIWRMVEDGTFPAPYDLRGSAVWPEQDIQKWIQDRIAGEASEYREPVQHKAITWDAVVEAMSDGSMYTARALSEKMDTAITDTRTLLALMWKAGTLERCAADPSVKKTYHYRVRG